MAKVSISDNNWTWQPNSVTTTSTLDYYFQQLSLTLNELTTHIEQAIKNNTASQSSIKDLKIAIKTLNKFLLSCNNELKNRNKIIDNILLEIDKN